MARPSDEEIDRAIIDTAARLFAIQGLSRTSVQQIADAEGYSKTGLLHRFGSKEALYEAAVDAITCAFDIVLDEAEEEPRGTRRNTVLIDRITGLAMDNPGLARLFFESTQPHTIDQAPAPLAARIKRFESIIGFEDASPEERLRIGLGFYLIVNAALLEDKGLSRDQRAAVARELARTIVLPTTSEGDR